MPALDLWMNGEQVAEWTRDRRGVDVLRYRPEWLASAHVRAISLSLPLLPDGGEHRGDVVDAFFENLLPDSEPIRRRMRQRFRTATTAAFDLLAEIGRDCTGAIQLMPQGELPPPVQHITAEPLDEAGIAALLRGLGVAPLPGQGSDDAFRISIAGAQEKTALLRHDGRWCQPHGTTPTTHIFKLPLGLVGNMRADMSTSVENEWLCGELLRAFGLPVARAEIARFEDQKALIVERFDRQLSNDGRWWMRLPQEDLCQALGVPPTRKYESEGGPGMRKILELLRQSSQPGDRTTFLRTQIAFWLLAATDGHAKNFSLHLERGGRFRLTPLYDVLSVYPILGRSAGALDPHDAKLAMAVVGKNRHYRLLDIRRSHWNAMARACGFAEGADAWIDALVQRVPQALHDVSALLPDGFPVRVRDSVFAGIEAAAKRLAAMPS